MALEGSVYPAAAEAGFIRLRASLCEVICHLWRIAHRHSDVERLIAALPNLAVLFFHCGSELNSVYSWLSRLYIPLGIDMKLYWLSKAVSDFIVFGDANETLQSLNVNGVCLLL